MKKQQGPNMITPSGRVLFKFPACFPCRLDAAKEYTQWCIKRKKEYSDKEMERIMDSCPQNREGTCSLYNVDAYVTCDSSACGKKPYSKECDECYEAGLCPGGKGGQPPVNNTVFLSTGAMRDMNHWNVPVAIDGQKSCSGSKNLGNRQG